MLSSARDILQEQTRVSISQIYKKRLFVLSLSACQGSTPRLTMNGFSLWKTVLTVLHGYTVHQ